MDKHHIMNTYITGDVIVWDVCPVEELEIRVWYGGIASRNFG